MVIKVSDYYKKKGYITAYLSINKEPRRVCTLRKADGTITIGSSPIRPTSLN